MRRRTRLLGLVVDASTAANAGNEGATAESGRVCWAALVTIAGGPFELRFSRKLRAEWRTSASRRSQRPLRRLQREGRTVDAEPTGHAATRQAVAGVAAERVRRAAEDDLHLIEAALDGDRRIVSRDRRARDAFAGLAPRVRRLKAVLWALATDSETVTWLGHGAADLPSRRLGAAAP